MTVSKFLKLSLLIALFMEPVAFSKDVFVLLPDIAVGADTYLKNKAMFGVIGTGLIRTHQGAAWLQVEPAAEYGVTGTATSLLIGATYAGPGLLVPGLGAKWSSYREHETDLPGSSRALGLYLPTGALRVWVGSQSGIIEGERRDGTYLSLEVNILMLIGFSMSEYSTAPK